MDFILRYSTKRGRIVHWPLNALCHSSVTQSQAAPQTRLFQELISESGPMETSTL